MDNSVLWTAPVTGELHEFPTPVTANGFVYYTSDSLGEAQTDTLYALDSATGEVIWTYDTGYADDAATVVNGRVFTAADSIYCLDALTGELVWVNGCADRGGSTPVVSEDKVYCGINANETSEETVFCLDSEDGSLLWSTVLPGGTQASCMGLADGRLFVPTTAWFVPGACLYALDSADGSILWQNSDALEGYWDSSPTVLDNTIYLGEENGYMRAIDAVTGVTVWVTPVTPGENYIASTPVIAYNRMYFSDQESSIHCFNMDTGSPIWSTPNVIHHGSSGVADSVLYLGEELILPFGNSPLLYDSACVRAFDCFTGIEIWNYRTLCSQYSGHQSSPSITDGVMYYACTDGFLYAFGTGLKYTYRKDFFYADIGSNELIVTSWDDGVAVAADTISFTVTHTGISLEPTRQMHLYASPNPIVNSTSICFELEEQGFVTVNVFDLSGREISALVNQELVSGVHSIQWNGCGHNGQTLSSGLYLCRIEHGGVIETTGLCVLR